MKKTCTNSVFVKAQHWVHNDHEAFVYNEQLETKLQKPAQKKKGLFLKLYILIENIILLDSF